jgi:hypothetical protein
VAASNPAKIPQTREKQRQSMKIAAKPKYWLTCKDSIFKRRWESFLSFCQGEGRRFESGRPLQEKALVTGPFLFC